MNKALIITAISLTLVGCQATSGANNIDIATYAPIIDVEGDGHDRQTYLDDLTNCRLLGQRAQIAYEEQRAKEQKQAFASAAVGAVAGAALGHVLGNNNNVTHAGRTTTSAAITGAAIGGGIGADSVDLSRELAKFGPTVVVDKCMERRGYHILSVTGFGGG